MRISNQIYQVQTIIFIAVKMNEYIFNDIYGSQSARNKYQQNPEYRYFNNVLKLHNKYYENGEMHNYIFNPRAKKKVNKLLSADKTHMLQGQIKTQTIYSFYNVEKINSRTFRVSKKNRTQALKKSQRSAQKQYVTIDQKIVTLPHRSIKKDVKVLQNTLDPKINSTVHDRNRKFPTFKKNSSQRYQQLNKKEDKPNFETVSRQLRSYSHQYSRNF